MDLSALETDAKSLDHVVKELAEQLEFIKISDVRGKCHRVGEKAAGWPKISLVHRFKYQINLLTCNKTQFLRERLFMCISRVADAAGIFAPSSGHSSSAHCKAGSNCWGIESS